MRDRRDYPVVVTLLTLALAAGLLVALYATLAATMRAQLLVEVRADIRSAQAADTIMPAVAALTGLERQSDREGRDGPLFLLIDPATGRPLAGNLSSWPFAMPRDDDCAEVHDRSTGGGLIACRTDLDGYFPLLMARRTAPILSMRHSVLLGFAALAVLVPLLVAGGTAIRLAHLRRRVGRIEAALRRFVEGDLDARPPAAEADVLGRLSIELGATLDRLAGLIRRQHIIAEQIAHDLKRPVAVALTDLDRAGEDPSPDTIERCRDQLAGLARLTDGILAISAITTGGMPVEPVRVDRTVIRIAALFHALAGTRGVVLAVSPGRAELAGWPALVELLLANLIGNAVKYTAAATTVEIATGQAGGQVTVTIADRGPGLAGMPPQIGYFQRGRSAAGTEGSGIGLAQVERVVAVMGGRIDLRDRDDGTGLRIVVHLPIGAPAIAIRN